METLINFSLVPVVFKSKSRCFVKSGKWVSSFTGKTIYKAADIDIDHLVPLSWAWEHGAYSWPKSKRVQFANDPINLLNVEASLNRQKGAKGVLEWLPPKNKCQYISRFSRVSKKYELKVPETEAKRHSKLISKHCL